ncbi:MAG: hypothetical protein KDA96_16445, partial [Planctomycetaceae bacterium]|nr:hypothetical protein [Planctomycetaceae bacterium]
QAIDESLQAMLAELIEKSKDKQAVRAVTLSLFAYSEGGCMDAVLGERAWGENELIKLIDRFSVTPAQQDAIAKGAAVEWLSGRHGPDLSAESCTAIASRLGGDLVAAWPHWGAKDKLREALTDHGRELLDASDGIPEFLRPFFGLKLQPSKPAKKK